jgi:uncharacterized protein (TIGR03067 family)
MRRHGFFLIGIGISVAATAGASRGNDPRTAATDDRAAIKGTWQLVYAETEGKPAPVDRVRNTRVEIKDGTHSVYFGDKEVVHDIKFTMDPEAKPKTTDDTLNEGPDAGKPIHGIYELDGDTLVSCVAKVGQERPKEFAAKPGSGHTLRVFKRVRAGEAPREKTIREELMRFGGTWKMSELVIGGNKQPKEGAEPFALTLRGDRWQAKTPEGITHGVFKVDPAQTPKTIDVTFGDGPEKGSTLLGIYELDGDLYRVCLSIGGQPRPKELVSKAGGESVLEVFTREKP